MKSVVQSWLSDGNLTLKQQAIVLSALRGCDSRSKHDLSNKLTKKINDIVLINNGIYDQSSIEDDMTLSEIHEFVDDYNRYPINYIISVCHCCEIIGYKHPNRIVRAYFNMVYNIIVDELHLMPDTEEQCDLRFCDEGNAPLM